jgi:hypothetical protein
VGDEELGSELLPSSLWLQHVALVENTGGGGSNEEQLALMVLSHLSHLSHLLFSIVENITSHSKLLTEFPCQRAKKC